MGKLLHGLIFSLAAIFGKMGAGYINGATPQASISIGGKSVNLVSYVVGTVGSGFGPKAGLTGAIVQGLAGGVAAGSDPSAAYLGGGSIRPGALPYGTLGV